MPNATLTLESFKDDVLTRLGATGVDVELEEKDVMQCLKDTLRLYNRNRPQRGQAALTVTTGQKKYGPIDTLYPGFIGVVDVQFTRSDLISGRLDVFNPQSVVSEAGTLVNQQGQTLAEVDQSLQYLEMGRRILSSEPEYKAMTDRDGHYYIYVDVSDSAYQMSFDYTWHITATDRPDPCGLWMIPDGDTDWIIDFAVASAKIILGRKRGKHQGIVNPDGATDTTDYADILAEGREDLRDLTEKIEARRRPLSPLIE